MKLRLKLTVPKVRLLTMIFLAVAVLALAACAAPVAAPSGEPAPVTESEATESGGESSEPAAAGDGTVLRMAWWGADPRHNMYNDLSDRYEELNPGITIEREFAGFDPYWERLATQVAGGNPPDIIHMHPNRLYDFGGRGALLDLTPYIESGQLDLSGFPQAIIDLGNIGDQTFMVTLGNSSVAMNYDPVLFEEAGVPTPTFDWTWSEWQDIVTQLQANLPEGVYAMSDSGDDSRGFRVFLRQRDKVFFDGDQLGFDQQDLQDYWQMWEELRAAGALPPAAMTQEATGLGHVDSLLATGRVAIESNSGNQHILYQPYFDHELGLNPYPHSDNPDDPFGYTVDGAYISLSANTPVVDESIDFLNWFLNDPDVALVYNGEHGPPGNSANAELVRAQASPAAQRLADVQAFIAPNAIPQGYQPVGGGETLAAFDRIYTEMAFGNYTLEGAVDAFFEEADFILNQ